MTDKDHLVYYPGFLNQAFVVLVSTLFCYFFIFQFEEDSVEKWLVFMVFSILVFSISIKTRRAKTEIKKIFYSIYSGIALILFIFFLLPAVYLGYLLSVLVVTLFGAGGVIYFLFMLQSIFKKSPSLKIDRNGLYLAQSFKKLYITWVGVNSLAVNRIPVPLNKPMVMLSFIARDGAVATYSSFFMKEKEIKIDNNGNSSFGDVLSVDLSALSKKPEEVLLEVEEFLRKHNIGVDIKY